MWSLFGLDRISSYHYVGVWVSSPIETAFLYIFKNKKNINSPPPHTGPTPYHILFSQRHFPKFPKNYLIPSSSSMGYFISGFRGERGRRGKLLNPYRFLLLFSLSFLLSLSTISQGREKKKGNIHMYKTFKTAIFFSQANLFYDDLLLFFLIFIKGLPGSFSLLV